MPACPPFKPGNQLRQQNSTLVFRSSGLYDAIEFPILLYQVTEPKGPYESASQYLDLMIAGGKEHNINKE